ncbi:MAG TPA: hypothetical protein QF850_02510, partial [Acidimicrobiales bacterium]|nr:hypothetical protein [Acidimicrobiales bacterium]
KKIGCGDPVSLESVPGGGTLPGVAIPSFGIQINDDISHELRLGAGGSPPIIARVEEGSTFLDFRTVDPRSDEHVASALHELT